MKFVDVSKIAVFAVSVSCGAANAQGVGSLRPFDIPQTRAENYLQVNFGVTGYDVQVVNTANGRFFSDGNGNWTEAGNDGGQFSFRELRRDDWSVYLRDDSRGVNIQLDIHTREVKYSDDNGQNFVLAQITDANNQAAGQSGGQVGNAYSSTTVEYTCNEGIPLVLTFENEGNEYWVSWSHDGFRGPNRLPNVMSGSGSKYSDGRNTVWEKGSEVYVNLDGIEDSCTRL